MITDTGAERSPLVEIHTSDAAPLVLPLEQAEMLAHSLPEMTRQARTSVTATPDDDKERTA